MFQLKLDSLLSKWRTSSRKVKSSTIVSVVLMAVIFTTIIFNDDLIITVTGAIVKIDDSVDLDSDMDSILNIGVNDSSYLNAQSLDGTDQVIDEDIEGGGGSSIRAKILENGLIDDRYYSPIYREGYRKYGQAITLGVPTYQGSNGNWYPNSSWQLSYENATHFGNYYNETSENWLKGEVNTSVVNKEYHVKGGRFESIFYNTSNEIRTNRFSFKQQPDRVGVLHAGTEEFTKWQDSSKPSDIVLNIPQKRLTYKDVYTDTDVIFTYDGERLKEVIHAKRANYPASPYPAGQSYVVFFTKIFDIDLVQQEEYKLKLYDDDGEIMGNKTAAGLLKMKNIAGKIVAYLPLGTATSNGMPDENVVWRVRKINNVWYILAGIRYGWLTHSNRVNPVFIDPTWVIGEDGDSWGDYVDFYQTMENTTTGYAQLYPSNTTGNITSRIGQAQKSWLKIQWQGDNHSKTVDIYWNSSRDNGITDPYEMNLVQLDSSPNINYSLPVFEKYGSWRLVLTTDNPAITPEIYRVTIYNDPPNADDFSYYKEIEINSDEVSGSGSHTDYPFLLYLASDSDLAAECQADFDDIAFSNDTAWLDHEIDNYNSGTGELIAWIRIPSLSTSSNITIYMYYGNATMGAQENPSGVWDSNYIGVWHLSEASGDALDSTSYGEDGTLVGGTTQGVSGQIDDCYDFDGTAPYDEVNMGDPVDAHLDFGDTDDFTLGFWFNIDAWGTNDYQMMVTKKVETATGAGYVLGVDVITNVFGFGAHDGVDEYSVLGGTVLSLDTWYYAVVVWDQNSASVTTIYLDGVNDEASSVGTIGLIGSISNSYDFQVGHWSMYLDPTTYYYPVDGLMDEVRISDTVRSSDWILTEYNNQYDPDSFFDIGIQQLVSPPTDNEEDYVSAITDNHPPDDSGTYDDWTNMQLYDSVDTLLNETSIAGGTGEITFIDSTGVVQSTAGSDLVTTVPTHQDGDLLIAIVGHSDDAPTTTLTPPAGWTLERDKTGEGQGAVSPPVLYIYYREASSEPASYTWSWDTSGGKTGIILCYRGAQIGIDIDSFNSQTGTGSDVISPTITTNYDNDWVVSYGLVDDNDGVSSSPSGMTSREELSTGTGGNGMTLLAADEERSTAGSTGTRTWTMAASEERSGGMFSINAVAGGGEDNYVFDREFSFVGLPLPSEYSYSTAELCIATGVISTEDLMVDVWNATSSSWVWIMNITDSDDNTWLNTSVFAYFNLEVTYLHFRFNDSLNLGYTGSNDTVNNEWYIDALLIHYWNITASYRLEWEHQCQNVPYTSMDSFNLTIYGNSSDSEDFLIQLWNETSNDWINTTFYIEQSETWYNFSIDDYSSGVIGSNITWRYLDNISTADFTLTTLRVDYAGIFYWNYSINLIETTWNLADYDATIDGWQSIPENPFNISISSFFDFDIEIQGVEVAGNPIANNYVCVSNTSDYNNGFNLTTSYQTLLSDQSSSTTDVQFWMFVAFPKLGGSEGSTFTWTVNVRISRS